MPIIERSGQRLVVAEDKRFLRLMSLSGLGIYLALTLLFWLFSGSGWVALTVGLFFLTLLTLILYVHSEQWEFDLLSGRATRTRYLLMIVPLTWRSARLTSVEVEERKDSDGGIEYSMVLRTQAHERVEMSRLGGLSRESVDDLARQITRAIEGNSVPPLLK